MYPQINFHVERYNVIIKTICMSLKLKKMVPDGNEEELQTVLHSIRSLLCTATNATSHERMFVNAIRPYHGRSLPTWLPQPGPILMKNHACVNKYEPIAL